MTSSSFLSRASFTSDNRGRTEKKMKKINTTKTEESGRRGQKKNQLISELLQTHSSSSSSSSITLHVSRLSCTGSTLCNQSINQSSSSISTKRETKKKRQKRRREKKKRNSQPFDRKKTRFWFGLKFTYIVVTAADRWRPQSTPSIAHALVQST